MSIDYNKITAFITNFERAEKLIGIYNRTKNVMVLDHFNYMMDTNWDLIESFTQEEVEYSEILCELWDEERKGL
jgi:hypothetical protein